MPVTEQEMLMETLPCGIGLYRIEKGMLHRLRLNQYFAVMLGYREAELLNSFPQDRPLPFVVPEDRHFFDDLAAKAEKGARSLTMTIRVRCYNGNVSLFELRANIAPQPDETYAVYGVFTNAQQSIRSAKQMGALMNSIPDGIALYRWVNDEALCTFFNDTLAGMLGYTRKEYQRLLDTDAMPLTVPEDSAGLHRALLDAVLHTHSVEYEYRTSKKDGSIIWMRVRASVFSDDSDTPLFYAAFTDITAARKEKDQREAYLSFLDSELRGLSCGIINHRRENGKMVPVSMNPAAARILKITDIAQLRSVYQAAAGRAFWQNDTIQKALAEAEKGGTGRFRYEFDFSASGHRHVDGFFQRLHSPAEGELFQVVLNDVSELVNQRRRLDAILENLPDCILVFRRYHDTGRAEVLYYNQCAAKASSAFSPNVHAEIAKDALAIVHEEDRPAMRARLEKLSRRGGSDGGTFRMLTDGTHFVWMTERTALLERNPVYDTFCGIYTDVSEIKRNEQRQNALINTIPGGVAVYHYDAGHMRFRCEYFNEALADMMGTTVPEFQKKIRMGREAPVFEGDRAMVDAAMQTLRCELKPADLVYRIEVKGMLRWIRARYFPYRNDTGSLVVYVVYLDIDEEKRNGEMLDAVLCNMPGGIAVGEYDIAENTMSMLYISDNLKRMLGYAPNSKELEAHWNKDRMADLPPQERSEIHAEFIRCAREHIQYHHCHQISCRDGSRIWVDAEMSFVPDDSGKMRVYTIFEDVTRQMKSEQTYRSISERYRLLSQGLRTLTFDYDGDTDTICYSEYDKQGHYSTRLREQYLRGDVPNPSIHTDDWAQCREAYEKLLKQPGTCAIELRALYDSEEYGWYRAHLVSVPEPDGSIRHVIGRVDDIQKEKEQEIQFRQIVLQRQAMMHDLAFSYCVNLTTGIVEDSHSAVPHAQPVGAVITDETFVSQMAQRIPDPAQKREFIEKFSPSHLLRNYKNGIDENEMEYRATMPNEPVLWIRIHVQVLQNPQTRDIIAFINSWNINQEKITQLLMHTIVMRDYHQLILVNAASGSYQTYNSIQQYTMTSHGADYDAYVREEIRPDTVPSEGQEKIKQLSRRHILHVLETAESGSVVYDWADPSGQQKKHKCTYLYLDSEKAFFVVCVQDITEIVREQQSYAQRLRNALDAANVAAEAKNEFMARMSHDMRTPLNAVLGYAQMAQETVENPQESLSAFQDIYASGEALLSLINDTLDLRKIENGPATLKPVSTCLKSVLEESVRMVKNAGLQFHVRLRTEYAFADTLYVMADPQRLRQIVLNLLTNAMKFSHEGGEVVLAAQAACTADIAHVTFTVQDHGCGMSKEFQHKMYEPFEQEANEFSSSRVGTGLGLPIVKSLTEMMQGSISCSSTQGVGTTFTVKLPLPIAKMAQHTDAHMQEAEDISILEGKRVLVCEDLPINAKIEVKMLTGAGMQIDTAENGKCGLERFTSSAPDTYDMILMDMRMPVMDGITAAKAIRALDRADAKRVPIIALTANAFAEDAAHTHEAGMNAHATKPIDRPALLHLMASFLAKPEAGAVAQATELNAHK